MELTTDYPHTDRTDTKTPNVVVVGATGFIGARVVRALVTHGYRPILVARHARDGFLEQRMCDMTRMNDITKVLAGAEFIVNCMAGSPDGMLATTQALLRAARKNAPQRIVHLSSMAVYGAAEGLVDENTAPVAPINPYAQAKIDCEALLQCYVTDGGDAVILRPTCVFGQGGELWTNRIARLLHAGRLGDLGVMGDGICNLVHVDDLALMIIKALGMSSLAGEAFNATSNSPRPTWNEFFVKFGLAIRATPIQRVSNRWLRIESKFGAPALRMASLIGRPIGLGRSIPDAITPSMLRLFQQNITVDTAKSSALGVAHRTPQQMIEEAARFHHR